MPNTPHISRYPARETFHVKIAILTCGKVRHILQEICFYDFARLAGAPLLSSTAPFLHLVSPSLLVMMVRRVKLKLRRGLGCSVATGSAGRHSCPPACLQRPAFQVCWASGQDMGSREREASTALPTWTHKLLAFSNTHLLLSLPPSCTLYCCVRCVHILPTHVLSVWPLSPLSDRTVASRSRTVPPCGQNSNQHFFGGDTTFCWGGIFLELNQTVEVDIVCNMSFV